MAGESGIGKPLKPAAPAAGGRPVAATISYLKGKLRRSQRLLTGLVGAALLPVMFFPILPLWRIFLVAPQYREGLRMLIFVDGIEGDLRNINILNHYIGMKSIDPSNFPEFGFLPWVITSFGLIAILAAVFGRRWLAFLGWAGFVSFGSVMMVRFANWMQDYGTNLDPKAALDFGAFTPPLLGTATRGNFVIQSLPHAGGVILLAAGLLGPILVAVDFWKARHAAKVSSRLSILMLVMLSGSAIADEFISYGEPVEVSSLQSLIDSSSVGDTLRLPTGCFEGQLTVDRRLTLIGEPDTVLDGMGKGTVLIIREAGVLLRGFTVRNSGWELLFDDAGILIDEADDVRIEGVILEDCNHGIYLRNALRPRIEDCRLRGRSGKVHEENHGNGIHLWHVGDALLDGNEIAGYRDGIYLSFAEAALVRSNLVLDQDRFGLHSMYSQRNDLLDNCFTRNTAGVALMFSNRMLMRGNKFIHNRGHRTYGLLLRDCSDSIFRHNRIVNNTIGLFLDGSNRNRFELNLIAENGWGLIAYSSSEENVFTKNSFHGNDYQVSLDMRRTKNRLHDEGFGNYWSDARPYDLDGDGLGDAAHRPVGLFAFVSKQHPDLTVFAGSPAVLALDMAQRSLASLQTTEILDPHPLLFPLEMPIYIGPTLPAGDESDRDRSRPLAWLSGALCLSGIVAIGRAR